MRFRILVFGFILSISQFSVAFDLCDLRFFPPVYSHDHNSGVYVVMRNNNQATQGLSFTSAQQELDTLVRAQLCSIKKKYVCDVKFYPAVYPGQVGLHVAMRDGLQFSNGFTSSSPAIQIVTELRKRGFCK